PSGDMTQGDLIRNTPGFPQAPVIYAWDLGPRNAELLAAFPHRTVYFFGQNKKTGVFYLKLLTLPNGNL
ncbi:MAG: hypothetical protein RBU29_12565, partial [bacterium]|nr:hypothetical protein [bacterium]